MLLNTYQSAAASTAIYPGQGSIMGILYCGLKLNGEAGEVAEKLGKTLRDNNGIIDTAKREALILELGDVMWYIANLATELNTTLEKVAQTNIDKLSSRQSRNVLSGSGDDR